jgi:AcrR family transcriptional regulator
VPESIDPPRRPQISRAYLEQHRRRRYVEALAELLHEFGPPGASVANLVRLAGTARNTFYEVFGSGEDCLAYDTQLARAELFAVSGEAVAQAGWAAEVEQAIEAFYRAVAARPLLAELLLIHAHAARDAATQESARAALEAFAPLFERGRPRPQEPGPGPPPLTAELLSRAVVHLAARRLRASEPSRLADEAPAIAALVLGFYPAEAAPGEAWAGGPERPRSARS